MRKRMERWRLRYREIIDEQKCQMVEYSTYRGSKGTQKRQRKTEVYRQMMSERNGQREDKEKKDRRTEKKMLRYIRRERKIKRDRDRERAMTLGMESSK